MHIARSNGRRKKVNKIAIFVAAHDYIGRIMWIVTRELLLVKRIIVGLIAWMLGYVHFRTIHMAINLMSYEFRERCQPIVPPLREWSASYSVAFQTIRCHAVTEQFSISNVRIVMRTGISNRWTNVLLCFAIASLALSMVCLLAFQRIQLFPVRRQPLARSHLHGTHCASEEFVYYEMKWFPGATHWLRLCHEIRSSSSDDCWIM